MHSSLLSFKIYDEKVGKTVGALSFREAIYYAYRYLYTCSTKNLPIGKVIRGF